MDKNSFILGDLSDSRNNNFDFIRLIAAVLVVFSHSFPLTLGDDQQEWLTILTNKQVTFGSIAVFIFFIVSGYLITRSYDKSKNLLKFFKARMLRIIPGLIVVVLITTFLLGPIITELSLMQYFSSKETYRYLGAIFIFKMPFTLPGVFENNPYPDAVNGSLWTLVNEAKCYIIIGGLGALNLLRRKVILIISIMLYVLFIIKYNYSLYMFVCFFAGSLLYMYRDKIKVSFRYFIVSLVLLLTAGTFGFLIIAFPILGSYIILYTAFNKKIKLHNFSKHGDFSYGVYIYAFPIQQLIVYMSNYTINPYLLFLIALPIIFVFSILSWHLIEKQCLKLKNSRMVPKFLNNNIRLRKLS